jgi:hypothetical protein
MMRSIKEILPMVIQLNFKSGKPVYLQVVDQIKAAAASGSLQPGERCPASGRSQRNCASTGTRSPRHMQNWKACM